MRVTVLCPNARRCYVEVTPEKLLRQVLEEACLKSGFDVDSHQLVNQKRSMDLSLPFRLSGLPNNATLEMIPATNTDTTGVATVALQILDSSRLSSRSSSLWYLANFPTGDRLESSAFRKTKAPKRVVVSAEP
ncbi:hypothetical protein KIN20_003175 [Parelaphostrongylus tenuis]|uniref:TUG ubiquitin-like domain-containing protein n=1 Tax=Parelaphostrongylus tenuis TaxID=148309 RepID=A0AAD5M0X8_PARTN|nr:hypothetical protein KIN20_003175 [Parelaphostrongylus tenuis]